jgi:phosphate transport system substrate-binding protein
MRKNLYILFAVFVLASMILAACGTPAATPQTVTVVQTQVVNQVQIVPATPDASMATLPAGSVQINGAGATFPLPIYTEWTYAYSYVDPAVVINYQGIGSGGGKKAIVDGTVDFAGSDSLLSQDEYDAGKDLQMYPAVAGAEVMIYNVEGLAPDDPPLVFSREVLVGIYDGTINTWNDPAITALNPDVASKLPNATITAVHRSDGSGTTEIFTRTLSSISQSWTDNVGFGSSVEWPVDKAGNGIGGKGNQGGCSPEHTQLGWLCRAVLCCVQQDLVRQAAEQGWQHTRRDRRDVTVRHGRFRRSFHPSVDDGHRRRPG